MKCIFSVVLSLSCFSLLHAQNERQLLSPDGNIKIDIKFSPELSYQVTYKNTQLISPSRIDMVLEDGKSLSSAKGIRKIKTRSNKSIIVSPVPEKRKNIPDVY